MEFLSQYSTTILVVMLGLLVVTLVIRITAMAPSALARRSGE